jgi:putative ABC transport system permease protein
LLGSRVSADWFRTHGVNPLRGRWLLPEEDAPGNNRVVVLSYGLWQRAFGGDTAALGRMMQLNGEAFEIVGVMPPSFRSFWNRDAELWTPLALTPENFTDNRRTNEFINFTARLKDGVTEERAVAALTAYADQIKRDFPNSYAPTWTLRLRSLNEQATGQVRRSLYILMGAVGFVLLIACANVANLMLARAASRFKEVAIRTALGARRSQLIRQLLTESVVLSLVGGVLGLGLAYGAVRVLSVSNPANLARADELGIDPIVLLFTLGVAVATGLLFGLAPTLQVSRTNLQESLKEGGRGTASQRKGDAVRRTLVVAQMALALTLLTGAGLLVRSFVRLQAIDPGFDPDQLLTFQIAAPVSKYPNDTAFRVFFEETERAVAAVPGVRAVGATTTMPFSGSWSTGSFAVEGYQPAPGQPSPWGDIRAVTASFFETMAIRVTRGRAFGPEDVQSSRGVVVVDEEMVKRFWPDQDPIGKRITRGNPQNPATQWLEVVGVVEHTAHEGLDADARVQLYLPYGQVPQRAMTFAVRTTGSPTAMTGAIRAAVQRVDKDMPLTRARTMDDMMSAAVGQRRFSMLLLAMFSALAALLAALGIYGVMSYSVLQRTHELGIRLALGAERPGVLRLVVRQGMELAILGVLLGALGGLWLTRLLQAQLYGVSPRDPVTFVTVAVLLAIVALAATFIPAMRATRVDPVVALRLE